MNKSQKRKAIVEAIKKLEEEKYGVEFDIETPLVLDYYIDNFKKGRFSLKNNTLYSILNILALGVCCGYTSRGKAIIFNNPHLSVYRMPFKYLNVPLEEVTLVETTYHEIAHLLQHKNIMSPYEMFCSAMLSNNRDGLKSATDEKYHNSFYHEMFANFYGMTNARKHFKGNEKALEYIDKHIGAYGVQKFTYDFEKELEKYQKSVESAKQLNDYYNFQLAVWNLDGTFKSPRQIIFFKSNSK